MTPQTINAELAKLTSKQRNALRARFGRKEITFLRCEEFLGRTDEVQVGFKTMARDVHYQVCIGPRGALRSVRCLGYAAV